MGLLDYEVGDTIDQTVLIKNADIRTAKNGKPFIAFVFSDQTGTITGKMWGAKPEDIAQFTQGKQVYLKGKRELYQTKPQVRIDKLTVLEEQTHSADNLVPQAPMAKADLEAVINEFVLEITEAKWNRIVRLLLKKYQTDFFTFPAAKTNHHAYLGGLAYHTVSMLKLGQTLSQSYQSINRPLLYAATILHDLGKVIELTGAATTEYSLSGNLIGHIVLIDEQIVLACQELNYDLTDEKILLLRHTVLAHHGQLEFGSPERPKLLEAEVLHQIDELDASITMISNHLEHTKPGNFTPRISALEQRQFYRPHKM
ncbi:3'-5' exoribonuclease YhaM family protein [Agrilactobacillus fermenti]|uniref:3'-5' exoribonuclease YhaM family protein n=1 Tax=Agrilactobacillus fermenti TaxID=2586909 RepID=UPI001E2B8C91|nr:HD domain-containing protein [Agrilactobacillus fermenti]MCD2256643.1 HD domain-containing protein [Agrilactobacillus fermenti]